MSFTGELDVCGEVAPQEIVAKPVFMEVERQQCMSLLKQDGIGESPVVHEEIIVNTNGYSQDRVDSQIKSTMYFEENLENCDVSKLEETINTVSLTDNSSVIETWDYEDVETSALKENESEEQEDDEETIATFVTAAGQQLALYAVEHSDEIFAVAVYNNESDEPPSNFQFLMKADVERLIGEGAVRTVKKPSQMKKRVFTAQPPTFYCKEESEEINDKIFDCDISVDNKKNVTQEENSIERNYETYQNYSDFKNNLNSSDSVDTGVEQSDITYLMMDDNFANIDEQPDECRDNLEFQDELMEHSTVQYILLEADRQSDSELTFDEILTTLQNTKVSHKKSLETDYKKFDESHDSSIQQDLPESLTMIETSLNEDAGEHESRVSSPINRTSVLESDRQKLIDALTDSPTTMITPQTPLRVKRSRKQQLVSVDRDDGEIIIQPASMMNEEITGRKRTVRRRQLASQIRVAMANSKRTKRDKKSKRRKVVEVIDLDVDEEEQQTTRNIVEITLDDNKDKYSSDKENEIIMVRDSDSDDSDEEEEEDDKDERHHSHLTKLNGASTAAKKKTQRCEFCSRNFRRPRVFKMHFRFCKKKYQERVLDLKTKSENVKKEYTCKICQEKFDMVVALARHTRFVHSQKKKNKLSLSPVKAQSKSLRSIQKEMVSTEEEDSIDEDSTTKRELSMLARVKRKRKQINYSLNTKKLNCADCGRWFPSSALLDAHCLQHGTKRSEQLRKCRICKKLIKSRLLFLRHLRMHNDTQHNSSSSSSSRMLRQKLRARPSTRKITSPRKRGRPRKF